MRIYQARLKVFLLALAAVSPIKAGVVHDATADYLAGWTSASNPNGAWSYGWSITPGSDFTKYTTTAVLVGQLDMWYDPSNFTLNTPGVYLNVGSTLTGQIDNFPGGALAIHGGGIDTACGGGTCFSEIVWTAPAPGLVDLAATFTGRETSMPQGLVEIIKLIGSTPTTLLSADVTDGTSQSLNQLGIAVQSGDQILFASRTQDGTLRENFTQIDATLTENPPSVPEPTALGLTGLGLAFLLARRRMTGNGE